MTVYDEGFYDTLNDAGSASADAVLPLVLDRIAAATAVDVGCGTGIWTAALRRMGVEALGLDGQYVPREQLRIEPENFLEVDLARPLDLGRTFDLAVSVEVAEHLPASRADGFVADLCALAPAVLFSAATPGQGGTHHVNEQWPDYWIDRFAEHGFTCWDVVRPAIRYEQQVAWIYRQNLLMAFGPGHPSLAGLAPELQLRAPAEGDVPFEYVARYILDRELGTRQTIKHFGALVARRLGAARSGRR